MKVESLRLGSFRNLNSADVGPFGGFNLFWGSNGQGKTNLLEAIYALSRGQSFRPYSKKEDFFPSTLNVPACLVEANLRSDRGLEHHLKLVFHEKKWRWFWNEKLVSANWVRERLPILVFSPDDHALVRGSPEVRRDYLDQMFIDVVPGYLELLDRYMRALKSRNRLLSLIHKKQGTLPDLKPWTTLLAETGVDLWLLRKELSSELETRVHGQLLELNIHWASKWQYLPKAQLDTALNRGQLLDWYQGMMDNSVPQDLATGWTHFGPHRDDFGVLMQGGFEAKQQSSQGQARVLGLVLRWVHAKWIFQARSERPVFLLDDFSSELDSLHKKQILTKILSSDAQVFVSSTDASLIDSQAISSYTCFKVENGRIYSDF